MRLLVFVLLCFYGLPSAAYLQSDQWISHAQPGGGSMFLPAGFTVVRQSTAAVGKVLDNGVTSYNQRLIDAKGFREGGINSVKADRIWKQDASGRVQWQDVAVPERVIRSVPEMLRKQGIILEVIDGPREFTTGVITGWRVSVKYNNELSRMDQFAFLKGGMLYIMSAAYLAEAAPYWGPQTDEIVARWRPAAVVGDVLAEADPVRTEWQAVGVSTGERFMLPPSWIVVAREKAPEKVSVDGQTVSVRPLLNLRPVHSVGDTCAVSIVAMSVDNSTTNEPVPISDDDLRDVHASVASGSGPAMKPKNGSDAVQKQFAGARAYFTELVAEPETGLPLEGFVLSTIRGDRAYLFTAAFSPGQRAEIESAIEEILSRSTFVDPGGTQREATLPAPVAAIAPATVASSLNPSTLLVSFLITWGLGLAPPLLIRYVVLRRPLLRKGAAWTVVGGFLVLNLIIFTLLGSRTHSVLLLVAGASYFILRKGAVRHALAYRTAPPN